MIIKRLLAVFLLSLVTFGTVPAFASDHEEHACKTDADCEHGEHCKDGHCHK